MRRPACGASLWTPQTPCHVHGRELRLSPSVCGLPPAKGTYNVVLCGSLTSSAAAAACLLRSALLRDWKGRTQPCVYHCSLWQIACQDQFEAYSLVCRDAEEARHRLVQHRCRIRVRRSASQRKLKPQCVQGRGGGEAQAGAAQVQNARKGRGRRAPGARVLPWRPGVSCERAGRMCK